MDVLCFKTGIQKLSWPITFGGGVDARAHTAQVSAMGRSVENSCVATTTPTPQTTTSSSRFSFAFPLRSLWTGGRKGNEGIALDDAVVVEDVEGEEISAKMCDSKRSEESWVLKILQVRSLWAAEREEKRINGDEGESSMCCDCDEEEEETVEFDRDSFSRLLKRVSLADARFYARMSYLGNLAYDIAKIKPQHLLKHHGLRFITSSVEKKAQSFQTEKENGSAQVEEIEKKADELIEKDDKKKKSRYQISSSAAYDIAASAASYVQSHTSGILSFKMSKDGKSGDLLEGGSEASDNEARGSEVASFVATTNSVTAVVAAKEETKQAVVKDLNSAGSSPCEWFICDDDQSETRFFVIQGSESLASWQANLLFEPIQFEGLDVLVHRGIYEAAKGIYEQMLLEVHAHLKAHRDSATLCFTGHSLGGSLALLVNLMLLIRGEVPRSSLLPVIMFGAPLIMCGGDQLLRRLGLPRNHVQAITMHRDIVPRLFSCNYPYHVAELLKAINGNFRNHPCLTNQKRLYSPMGELLILQPEENFSPHHHLLPSGSGLYVLSGLTEDSVDLEKHLQAAQAVFFNSPHPLEILSDRSAYGSDGTIYRDHDMNSYLKSVLGVIRLELNRMRKAKRESRREVWWPLISPQGIHAKINIGRRAVSSNLTQSKLSVTDIFQTGRESMRQLSSLVASQHVHLPVLLLLGAWAEISF